jgi:hypothetical protein
VENLFSILLLLACPIGMGLAMWLMMRGSQHQPTGSVAMSADHAVPSVDGGERPATPLRPGGLVSNGHVADTFKPTSSFVLSLRRSLGGLCLNWKVIGGLAAVGLSIWIMAPGLVWAALPLLLLAACPLSMLLMMRGMASGQCAAQSGGQVAAVSRDGDERIAALKAQLASIQAQQEAIVRQLAELETTKVPVLDLPAAGDEEITVSGARQQPPER